MINKISKYIIFVLLFLITPSCKDNVDIPSINESDELPVSFDFSFPAETRSIPKGKSSFTTGDLIHVSGVFTLSEGEPVTKYGAYIFTDTNSWQAVNNETLTWPALATSATFTAYYIPGEYTGLLSPDEPIEVGLSELPDIDKKNNTQSDPLVGTGSVDGYGKSVFMTFKHLCTYLTLTDVRIVSEQYYFYSDDFKEDYSTPRFSTGG